MRSQIFVRCFFVLVLFVVPGCGTTGPSPALAFTVTANPSPASGGLCTGCGAGSTEREVLTTLTLRETGGGTGSVTSIALVLRENGTNAVLAQGEFDAAAVTQLAGSNRLTANGTLAIPIGVHYGPGHQGKVATWAFTIRLTDGQGRVVSEDITVPVPSA
jgi:hypothetical protein